MSEEGGGSSLKAGHPPAVKAGGMRVVQHKEKHESKKDANVPEETTNPLGDPNPEKHVVAPSTDLAKVDMNKTPSALRVTHEKPMPAVQAKHAPAQKGHIHQPR